MLKGILTTMLTAQPSSPKRTIPPANENFPAEPTLKLRYEFILKVQGRDIICTLYKTMFAPLLPLTCDNITIGTGFYTIARTRVDMDEATIYIWLAPLVIHRLNTDRELEAFEQVIKELKEGQWHE